MADDELTAVLAGIRQRSERPLGPTAGALPISNDAVRGLLESAADVPPLFAIVDALLKDHCKVTLYAVAVTGYDSTCRVRCGHSEAEMENDRHQLSSDSDDILCLDQPEAEVCATCWDNGGEQVEWPCPVYRDIRTGLLGEENDGA
jgi:hypothetical protein